MKTYPKPLPYYQRIARDAPKWVRGLTAINGGENLLWMARDFDRMAQDRRYTIENRRAFVILAGTLWEEAERRMEMANNVWTGEIE